MARSFGNGLRDVALFVFGVGLIVGSEAAWYYWGMNPVLAVLVGICGLSAVGDALKQK